MYQSDHNGAKGVLPADEVGHDNAAFYGGSVFFTGHVHDAAAGLCQNVITGVLGFGARLTERGDSAIDDRGINSLESLVIKAHLFH